MKVRYRQNKSNIVGDLCICPSCGSRFVKTTYAQAFCQTKTGTKCKDKYWNTVTPDKRNNQTRISPASAEWTAKQIINNSYYDAFVDNEHPYSSEALGQW